jgi:hypothetical protein
MPRDSNRRTSSRNESWSSGVLDMARDRPIAAAAVAAGAAATGLFLWSKRNQITQQLTSLSDQLGEWSENMTGTGEPSNTNQTAGTTTTQATGARSNTASRSGSGSRGRGGTTKARGMSETGGGNASLGAQSGGAGAGAIGASPGGRGRAGDNS